MSTLERCSFCPGTYYASYFSAPLPDGFQLPIVTEPGLLAHRAFLERRTTGQYRKLLEVDRGYGACCEFCLEDGLRDMMKDWYFVWYWPEGDLQELSWEFYWLTSWVKKQWRRFFKPKPNPNLMFEEL